ncbi:tetratricopeptide repeat protein [Puteibacter caeruleilacunae]|nr:tetratricopeptide repeat protein [Puteibacter caeruleilacunae]
MFIRLLTFLFVFSTYLSVNANSKQDSLLYELSVSSNLSEQQDLRNKLFWEYIYENPDSAYVFAKQGIEDCSKNDFHYQSMFNNLLGIYYYFIEDFNSAEIWYKSAIQYAEQANDTSQLARCLNNFAIIKDIQGNYQEAEDIYDRALQLHKKKGNIKQLAQSYGNLAVVQQTLGKYEEAIANHLYSIAVHDSLRNDEGKAFDYNNIGLIKRDQGKSNEAIEYYHKALDIFKKINLPVEEANVYVNIANIYAHKAVFDIAIDYYEKALSIYREKGAKASVGVCFINIAELQKNNKEWENAAKNLEDACVLFDSIGYHIKHFDALINYKVLATEQHNFSLADSLLKCAGELSAKYENQQMKGNFLFHCGMLEFAKGNFSDAKEYYQECLQIFKAQDRRTKLAKTYFNLAQCSLLEGNENEAIKLALKAKKASINSGVLKLQMEIENLLFQAYQKTERFRNSNLALSQYMVLKDSLLNAENIKQITAFQLKEDYNKQIELQQAKARESELLLRSKINHQIKLRNTVLFFLVVVTVLLVITYLEFSKKKKAHTLLVKKSDELAGLFYKKQNKAKKQPIVDDENRSVILKKLEKYLVAEKNFMKPGIRITDVAKKIKTNSTYLSQIINSEYDKNFNQLINEYRIREACIYIHNGEYTQLSIEGISKSVGFNNRTSFIHAFKKVNGVTPSFYINSLIQGESM